jgi:hypothetical protein
LVVIIKEYTEITGIFQRNNNMNSICFICLNVASVAEWLNRFKSKPLVLHRCEVDIWTPSWKDSDLPPHIEDSDRVQTKSQQFSCADTEGGG